MSLENLNDVLELFRQIGGTGNENCIFFLQKDQAKISENGIILKTVDKRVANNLTCGLSGMVSNIFSSSDDSIQEVREALNLDILNSYTQFLINETESSIAIIPMLFNGVLHWETDNAKVFPESGRVIPKNLIKKVEINKFSFLTPTIRGVKFELIDGCRLEFMAITNVKTLPYHIENFKKFNKKYKKK